MTYATDTLELAEAEVRKHAGHVSHGGCIEEAFLRGFDAGCAHALATVTRTISTAAELDALKSRSVVLDADGDAWQMRGDGDWSMVGCDGAYSSSHVFSDTETRHPVTLLVPATAAPEPVRLTDPDDPRIKPGARVRLVEEYTLSNDDDTCFPEGLQNAIRLDSGHWYLLTEAPEPDPDAGWLEIVFDSLAEALTPEQATNIDNATVVRVLASLRKRGL